MTPRLPVVLAACLLSAACGAGAAEPTVAPSTSTTAAPANGGSGVLTDDAPEALQFSASLVGGGDIELTTLAGRPVLLWFWAPW